MQHGYSGRRLQESRERARRVDGLRIHGNRRRNHAGLLHVGRQRPREVDARRDLQFADLLQPQRSGATLLGNGDLVELTGLPKATVSRLARTLVEAGYLEHDTLGRGYRLGLPLLGLAQALRSSSTVLQAAAPRVRKTAQALRINVGVAVIA